MVNIVVSKGIESFPKGNDFRVWSTVVVFDV